MKNQWRCESLRLTAIWSEPREVAGLLTWESVVGSQPDQRQDQPKQKAMREFGAISGGAANLEMRSVLGRVDWLMAGNFPSVPTEQGSLFEDFLVLPEALTRFSQLLFDKSAVAYDASRIAIGINAVRPTESNAASYAELAKLLPNVKVPLEGASEFLFQINRPRPSLSAPNMTINRMSRWMSIGMGPIMNAMPQILLPFASVHAARVELDISTPADRTSPIPKDLQRSLYVEMSNLAEEILERGDCP